MNKWDKMHCSTGQFLNLMVVEVVFPGAHNNLKIWGGRAYACYVHVRVMGLLAEVNSLILLYWAPRSNSFDSKHLFTCWAISQAPHCPFHKISETFILSCSCVVVISAAWILPAYSLALLSGMISTYSVERRFRSTCVIEGWVASVCIYLVEL